MQIAPGTAEANDSNSVVTGASGFIGRHLVCALLRQDRQVVALCRNPGDLQDLDHPRLKIISADLEQPLSYIRYLGPATSVFHLAAVRSFPGANPDRMYRINQLACLELGRACLQATVARFVYVSSAVVFGPSDARPNSEQDSLDRATSHCYIRSRVQALIELRKLFDEGLNLITVCPTIVFGPDHPSHPNRITNYLRRLVRFRLEILIAGGRQRRNLVYVHDVVRGILLAETFGNLGEEYILGGEDISPRDFNRISMQLAERELRLSVSIPRRVAVTAAQLIDRLCGHHPSAGYGASIRALTREMRFSSEKSRRLLGYSPISFSDAMKETVGSLRLNQTPL
ncbi:MAG: NAD-dependent epimerase/dehydratase family protein [Acidobacteria bacterium]|nr:NAD-dependent epimerase/dehydratase family protein [Acidobacteriota bacterium]